MKVASSNDPTRSSPTWPFASISPPCVVRIGDAVMTRTIWILSAVLVSFGVLAQAALAGSIHAHPEPDASQATSTPNLSYYRSLGEEFESDPREFDHHHPLLGRLLSNPALADRWIEHWEKDETRYEHRYPHRSAVLQKYLLIREAMSISAGLVNALVSPLPHPDPKSPPISSPFTDPTPSVPEPSGLILTLTAFISLGFAATIRRICQSAAKP
jgi:hypothetical protein